MQVIKDYVQDFFQCTTCQRHFKLASQDSAKHTKSKASASLWLWELHNRVRIRLAPEWGYKGDIAELLYPPMDKCDACRESQVGLFPSGTKTITLHGEKFSTAAVEKHLASVYDPAKNGVSLTAKPENGTSTAAAKGDAADGWVNKLETQWLDEDDDSATDSLDEAYHKI